MNPKGKFGNGEIIRCFLPKEVFKEEREKPLNLGINPFNPKLRK